MKKKAAEAVVREVAAGVGKWKAHFRRAGVAASDIEVLARYIDGERLAGPRRTFAR